MPSRVIKTPINFSRADGTGASFAGANLAESLFDDAILRRVNMTRFRAPNVSLRGATLDGALLHEAQLQGADLRGATVRNIAGRDINLAGSHLDGLAIENVYVPGLSVAGATAPALSLAGTTAPNAVLCEAQLPGAKFEGARLPSADFRDANLQKASFKDAVLTNANFCGARLEGVNWDGANLDGAVFCGPNPRDDERLRAAAGAPVQFAYDSSALAPATKATLDVIAGIMKASTQRQLTIAGHTDSTGSDAYNLGLSDRRAAAVKRYLIDQGVAAARLHTTAHGKTQPIAPNDTEEGRAKNRRVEMTVREARLTLD